MWHGHNDVQPSSCAEPNLAFSEKYGAQRCPTATHHLRLSPPDCSRPAQPLTREAQKYWAWSYAALHPQLDRRRTATRWY